VSGGPSGSDKKNVSLDSIFQGMLKANKVDDEQTGALIVSLNDENSNEEAGRRDLSTKEMNYEQIMVCLRKKTLKTKQEERRKQQDEEDAR